MSDDTRAPARPTRTPRAPRLPEGLALSAAVLPALAARAQAAPASAELTATLEPVRRTYGLPALAAATVRAGQLTSSGACGVRALGSTVPVSVHDRFHLGSDTKAMTALLCGMAVESGKLRWESHARGGTRGGRAGLNPKLAAVTLEQLLSHSAGIPSDTEAMKKLYFNTDAFDYNLTPLRLRMLAAWKATPRVRPRCDVPLRELRLPDRRARCSSMPRRRTWEELITRRIFEPLKLTTAGLGPQATRGSSMHRSVTTSATTAASRRCTGALRPTCPRALGPAGNAHMSVLDFATWAGWNAGGARRAPALVKPATLARIQRGHVDTGKIPDARPGSRPRAAMRWAGASCSGHP